MASEIKLDALSVTLTIYALQPRTMDDMTCTVTHSYGSSVSHTRTLIFFVNCNSIFVVRLEPTRMRWEDGLVRMTSLETREANVQECNGDESVCNTTFLHLHTQTHAHSECSTICKQHVLRASFRLRHILNLLHLQSLAHTLPLMFCFSTRVIT